MKQVNIKNDDVASMLDRIVARTGEGKTEAIRSALELYERQILGRSDIAAQIEWIRENVHSLVEPEHLGRQPSKAEVERELKLS